MKPLRAKPVRAKLRCSHRIFVLPQNKIEPKGVDASKLIELQDTRFLELFKPKVTMDPTPRRGGVGRGGGEPLPYCSCRDNSMDISLVYCATFFCIIQGLRLSGDVMNLSFPLSSLVPYVSVRVHKVSSSVTVSVRAKLPARFPPQCATVSMLR